jgi:hypothetical protein
MDRFIVRYYPIALKYANSSKIRAPQSFCWTSSADEHPSIAPPAPPGSSLQWRKPMPVSVRARAQSLLTKLVKRARTPHRRTAAPPHRRTAAPPHVWAQRVRGKKPRPFDSHATPPPPLAPRRSAAARAQVLCTGSATTPDNSHKLPSTFVLRPTALHAPRQSLPPHRCSAMRGRRPRRRPRRRPVLHMAA